MRLLQICATDARIDLYENRVYDVIHSMCSYQQEFDKIQQKIEMKISK